MTQPVRFASLGLGWWGRVLAKGALESGAGEIVTCFARNPEQRESFAGDFGCDTAASVEDVLTDDRVEAVFVATPHGTHASIVLAALGAGKHVFVEKPLTLTSAEAETCLRAAEDAGLVLQVGHHRRRQAANRRIRAMIDAGELGVVEQVEANHSGPALFGWPEGSWRRRREEMPAGAMTLMGCHMLDTMQYFLGPVARLCAFSKRVLATTDVDDATAVLLEFESGPLGYLGTSTAVPKTTTITVYGSEAAVWNEEDGTRLFVQRRGEEARHELELEQNDPIAEELADFARCVREGGTPETGAGAGLAVVRLIEAVVRSADERVFVELGAATHGAH